MHSLLDLLKPEELIRWGGYVGLTLVIFAETGLLIGFFLPGDSLLVTAGLLASQGLGELNIALLGVLLSVAAIAGNSVGYAVGKTAGPRLFTRENSLLFNKRHLIRAHQFYEAHGGKTMVLARFMPIVRTFVPVVAGMAEMDFRAFTIYNVGGGLLWIWSMLLVGFGLGRYVPGVAKHIELMIVTVIFLSILPGIIAWWRERKKVSAI
ncbi:MAG: VTT domain-containing protein [Gemmatimonadaceae bacterium]